MEPLSREEALRVLEEAPVAHLGMIDRGMPYVTPMSFVFSDDRVLFRTMAGRKLDALRANPNVCVEASRLDEETGDWHSVIVSGQAREVDEDSVQQATVAALLRKYDKIMGPVLSSRGIQPFGGMPHFIEVVIDEVSGMSAGGGFSLRTRPGRL